MRTHIKRHKDLVSRRLSAEVAQWTLCSSPSEKQRMPSHTIMIQTYCVALPCAQLAEEFTFFDFFTVTMKGVASAY